LLDPHLAQWIRNLSNLAYSLFGKKELLSVAQVLYQFCKVRGFKTILQWFPCAVANVKPVIKFAREVLTADASISENVDFYESQHMYLQYVMTLWASFVLQIPFNLDRVLNSAEDETNIHLLLSALQKKHLQTNSKVMEAAAYFLAVYYKRPDRQHEPLRVFLTEIEGQVSLGSLRFLAQLSKLSDGNVLLEHCEQIESLLTFFEKEECRSLQQKLLIKLRAFLFISQATRQKPIHEGIVRDLLNILATCRETSLRWAAAKCLRRIVAVLDAQSQVSVSHFLLDLVDLEMKKGRGEILGAFEASPAALHGCFLALGQLISHGCYKVNATRASFLLDAIIFGLRFDQVKGSYSVGSNVRDATCYVCWSWSRRCSAGEREMISDERLLSALLCMALFDREVSGRRAAAAALQEWIGRLSKHSAIPLLEHVNFFTLSSIEHSFQVAFPSILKLSLVSEESFFYHLSQVTLFNFDKKMRCLAAEACSLLHWNNSYQTRLLQQYKRESDDLYAGHGTLLTLARLIGMHKDEELLKALVDVSMTGLNSLSPKFLGFELALEGHLELISALSQHCSDEHVVSCWLKYLQLALKINKSDDYLRHRAMNCLMKLASVDSKFFMSALAGIEVERDVNVQKGHMAAVAAAPEGFFQCHKHSILKTLLKAAKQTVPINDIERRLWAIKAVSILLKRQTAIEDADRQLVLTALIDGPLLLDYTTDQRGDVGSKVRLAAMNLWCDLGVPMCEAVRDILLEQLFGRLDRLRSRAAEILQISTDTKDLGCIWEAASREKEMLGVGLFRGLIYACGGINADLSESAVGVLAILLAEGSDCCLKFQTCTLQLIESDSRLSPSVISTLIKLQGRIPLAKDYCLQLSRKIILQLIPSNMTNIRKLLPMFQLLLLLGKDGCKESQDYLLHVKDTFKYPVIRQLVAESNKTW